jgi:hypothetical protein
MAYSESLFTALAAWSLYAVLTDRWVTAGTLALFAGLTRPVGLAVVAAVWVTALASFARDRRAAAAGARDPQAAPATPALSNAPDTPVVSGTPTLSNTPAAPSTPAAPDTSVAPEDPVVRDTPPGPEAPPRAGTRVRRILGMALAPLGTAGYVLWVGHHTGKGPLGYLEVQAGWRNGFDGGWAFARFVADKFTSFPAALAGVGLIIGVASVVWLYATGVRQRQPLPLLVYTGVVTALALCASSYFGSKPRLLLPAFPLLLPLALSLAGARMRRSAAVLGGVAVACAAYGAFWLNGSGPP